MCQIGPKTVEQLLADPRVVVPKCDGEQNVPDLSDIGCYVECSTAEEDIYYDNKQNLEDPVGDTDKLHYLDSLDIEGNLTKLFNGDTVFNDEETTKVELTKPKKRKSRKEKIKKKNKDQLMSLFGSTFEDEDETSPKKVQERRQSLPVSISISNQVLRTYSKKCTKRKSETDLGLCVLSKQQRTEGDIRAFCEVRRVEVLKPIPSQMVNFNFVWTSNLITVQKTRRKAVVRTFLSHLDTAKVEPKPQIFESSDSKTVKMPLPVIDLTGEDSGVGRVPAPIKTGNAEIKKEFFAQPTPSEEANAPAYTLSMPLLSPVSPAVPPQMEQVLPEKSQTSVNYMKEVSNNSSQRPSAKTSLENRNPPPPYQKPKGVFNFTLPKPPPPNVSLKPPPYNSQPLPQISQQRQPNVSQSILNVPYQAPPNVTVQPPPASRPALMRIRELLDSNPRPPNVTATTWQPPPQLYRIPCDYTVVSHSVLATKLFPYLIYYLKWRFCCTRFANELKSFLPTNIFKSDSVFKAYCEGSMSSFGKRLIQDISQLDVENFDLSNVVNMLISKIFHEQRTTYTVQRIVLSLHEMIYHCEQDCNTPFAKEFFKIVQLCSKKLDSRTSETTPFSPANLERLKKQIQQHNMIQNWINTYALNESHQKQQSRPTQPTLSNNSHNTLEASINHVNSCRQYQAQSRIANTQESTYQRQQDLNTQRNVYSVNVPHTNRTAPEQSKAVSENKRRLPANKKSSGVAGPPDTRTMPASNSLRLLLCNKNMAQNLENCRRLSTNSLANTDARTMPTSNNSRLLPASNEAIQNVENRRLPGSTILPPDISTMPTPRLLAPGNNEIIENAENRRLPGSTILNSTTVLPDTRPMPTSSNPRLLPGNNETIQNGENRRLPGSTILSPDISTMPTPRLLAPGNNETMQNVENRRLAGSTIQNSTTAPPDTIAVPTTSSNPRLLSGGTTSNNITVPLGTRAIPTKLLPNEVIQNAVNRRLSADTTTSSIAVPPDSRRMSTSTDPRLLQANNEVLQNAEGRRLSGNTTSNIITVLPNPGTMPTTNNSILVSANNETQNTNKEPPQGNTRVLQEESESLPANTTTPGEQTKDKPVPENCERETVITTTSTVCARLEPDSSSTNLEEVVEINGKPTSDVIDLTWLDDGDETEILEEVRESKAFLCKQEAVNSDDATSRESLSPTDSGLGSPQPENSDSSFKCFCGNVAIFVCACKKSMYCSAPCQHNDWVYHQRMCNESTR